ncbi:MAG: adenosylcobalamin-dependent ribonucleoside-diphosphate reductase [Saprospiraceae bacterium]|nr:adenosylcobalamin-dependent ribonucleoside-diphosphate reductase [Saprospiraceae bacterium]
MNADTTNQRVPKEEIIPDLEVFDLDKETLKTYTYNQALKSSLKYFNGDELAASVWINKYALKDSQGKIYERNPDDMHLRMAKEIYRVEKNYPNPLSEKEIYNLLKDFRYLIPQGGSMSGIGNNFQASSLSNCFVIGNQADSYGGIMKTDEEQTQLMKRRGGVGHDLSHIRPKNSPVKNSALSSTGIVPFMERFSNSTREVAQDGRRGALMLSISSKHPDVGDFVDAKLEAGKITGANISVKIDDAFMEAVVKDKKYTTCFPINQDNPSVSRDIKARELWGKLVKNAWKSAEPGILFWDTIIRESIPDCYSDLCFRTVSTNPCGEIPLCPYDSCRLLAINLFSYVENPFTEKATFNFELFEDHVGYATRMMDDIIDLEIEKIDRIIDKIRKDPEDEEIKTSELHLWKKIRKKCVEGRRTGIGITAEGDMLAALNYRYGSDEAIDFSVKVHQTLALNCYGMSTQLAEERGMFPVYDSTLEANNPFVVRLKESDPGLYKKMKKSGRRNIALLTIAPTGTTSLMSQTSSGIEPVFMVSYKRRKKINPNDEKTTTSFVDKNGDHWEEYNVVHHKFKDWMEAQGMDSNTARDMGQKELDQLIAQSPYHKSTSNDIDWVQKVKMQGAIQKWVDHSISVTVNLPNDATVELVDELMITAWRSGCKGITIYRDGSRDGVLISNDEEKKDNTAKFMENHSPKRPEKLEVEIIRFQNLHEKWIAVVGLLHNKPYEIFTGKAEETFLLPKYVTKGLVIKARNGDGKSQYNFQYEDKDGYKVTIEGLSRSFKKEYWNYAKLISGVLRHGMPLPYVVDLVSRLNYENEQINSWANGVKRALGKFIPNGTPAVKETCEGCGEHGGLSYREGCLICNNCGFSRCH